ncbi:MAG: hypothetical protein JWL73_3080 [Actinomycetia bacterium]|nr:hypothetical protein [Actinomycetes bacterium]
MKTSLISRALAATAAVGVALILPATAASAQTVPPVVPPAIPPISVTIGATPVLTIGATPTPPTGTAAAPSKATVRGTTNPSATAAPVDGIRALVPADAGTHATVGNPLPGLLGVSAGTLPGTASVPGLATLGQPNVADADAQVNACIAAALLTGQPVAGCSSSISAGQPSLVDALSSVGICARAKVLSGTPVTPCGVAAGADGADAGSTPSLANVASNADLCIVAGVLSGTATPCPTTDPLAVTPIGSPIGSPLGITGGSTNNGGTPDPVPSTVSNSLDVCIGAAVLTNSDLTPCTTSAALTDPGTTPITGTLGADVNGINSTDGINGANGAAAGNGSGSAPATNAALDLTNVAAGNGNLSTPLGTLPFTGLDAGVMVLFAVALIGSGIAMRRLRTEHLPGNDTRFPRRPEHVS